MSAVAQQYRKLGGSGMQMAGHARLYLGSDHVLQVSATGFSERYKRFYFRDIQAFIVMPNIWWLVSIGVLACVCLGSFAITLANLDEPVILGVFAGIGAVFLGLLIWSFVRGESCRTYVRTAVQLEALPSLGRARHAKQIIASLQPLIEASQAGAAVAAAQPSSAEPMTSEPSPEASPIIEPPTS